MLQSESDRACSMRPAGALVPTVVSIRRGVDAAVIEYPPHR
jgi:hypothetical protein